MGQEKHYYATSFQDSLWRVYGSKETKITPARTQKIIARNTLLVDLSQKSQIENLAVLGEVFNKEGKFKNVKFEVFLQSLDKFRNSLEFKPELLNFLDAKCIHNSGKLSVRRLKKLKKEKENRY